MKNKELKDNLQFKDTTNGIVFNHFSFCEMVKHIMVKYGNITYKNADKKLKNHFLIEVPKSLSEIHHITHELEFHWAMLILHGDRYWTKGISNDFEDEYLNWQEKIRLKYKLKESYKYYEIEPDKI